MSTSLLTKFTSFRIPPPSRENSSLILWCASMFSTFHLLYAFGTKESKSIQVAQKYTFSENGYSKFMIVDECSNHYCVNNSFWYWKWDSIEDWTAINVNDYLQIKYYGYRIPLLGIFPNIFNHFVKC